MPFSNLQLKYQHPKASGPLILPVQVVCNTPEAAINENIRINSRRAGKWLFARPAHDGVALLCGSGPSLRDDLPLLRFLVQCGGTVFSLNGATRFLDHKEIVSDYQVILDAQPGTVDLIGPAREYLFASQVDPACFEKRPTAMLWHLQVEGIDDLIPAYADDYTLIGAASSVGTTALVVAFALGFRKLKCFGYDSSMRGEEAHVTHQTMNDGEPRCSVQFGGRDYRTSLTMKLQAERFPVTARLLQREGCKVEVFGEGLLPDIWNAPAEQLSEKEKYERIWSEPSYRLHSPGEMETGAFLEIVEPRPGASVIDFGCGTGRAGLVLSEAGMHVTMLDFAANCRDPAAMYLPFFEHDLSWPMPYRADYGFCCDVMEHIPPEQTRTVLYNLFEAAPRIYFRIDTRPDVCGVLIGQELHLTLLHHEEWLALLGAYGEVTRQEACADYSVFYVERM